MKEIYIEFLKELYIQLENDGYLMWSKWIKKCIERFNDDEDLTYFLSTFRETESFDNYFEENIVMEELTTITYSCAVALKNNSNDHINDILKREIERINNNIYQCKKESSEPSLVKQLINYGKALDYIIYIDENYEVGNLSLITDNYLNGLKSQSKSM